MSDPVFRADQAARLREPHVAPFADLVDELRAAHPGREVPYVAPTSRGTRARVLVLHRSPAPSPTPAPALSPAAARPAEVSEQQDEQHDERHEEQHEELVAPPVPERMLSVEGDDGASERLHGLLTDAGIDPSLVLPWHAVPWTVDPSSPLSGVDAKAGRLVLARVVSLLPQLRVVVLHGREVEPVWDALATAGAAVPRGIRVERTFSTEDSAVQQHRASRLRRLAAVYSSAADALS